ncbi:MAG: hypothetical protein A2901_06565 [Elusimicrobia bacterium RIFCSPLOWO2_01_FULL_54_10]|nr:MAG: hypothetical protein A2901_06565 [Elusimicrobia bacterium RIFCSPLOWO2_01_FULL_54_10]
MKKIQTINLAVCKITPEVLRLVPVELMKKHSFVPFDFSDERLSIAIANPKDSSVLDDIQVITGLDVDAFQASREMIWKRIEDALPGLYASGEVKEIVLNGAEESEIEHGISKTVDQVIRQAVERLASDIHIEPQETSLYVRFRIDGVLSTICKYSKAVQPSFTARIKVMAGMDITERRLPQDNQFSQYLDHRNIDFRVSTLPGKYGEKVVIRVLDKSSFALDLSRLGMDTDIQTSFEAMIQNPQGLILVTGPTGSGKTTTLYSVLNRLTSPEKNIITLEDPVEYELLAGKATGLGITQVHVNSKIGMTFTVGLKASLRQDPDIIMVGEIRDRETAEIAMKSALTGHLVLSTLHTNDSFSTLIRLRDMGVEPYLIAATVTGIMAQRLVRVLCPQCKEAYHPPAKVLKLLFPGTSSAAHEGTLYRAKGCESCRNIGYRGRKGIYELLAMNDDLAACLKAGLDLRAAYETSKTAILKTMRSSGLDLVSQGLTTVEEVFRTTIEA